MEEGSDQAQVIATKRPVKWLLVFCAPTTIVLTVAVVSHGPPEPVYAGRGLSHWLGGNVSSPAKRAFVIESVGPEALPWLVNALPALELRYRFNAWCLRAGRSNSPLANRLLRRLTDPHRQMAYFNACSLLARLAPGSTFETKALRAFVPHRPGDDTELIRLRLGALGRCTNSPERVIPILISELRNFATVDRAIDSLANFGSLATSRLYPLALAETGMIRPAEVALERADPLAYKRLLDEKERRNNH